MKFLTHERDGEGDFQKRVLLHIPAGLLMGVPLIGIPLLCMFIRYEENEDAHEKDEAWKDYFGAMVGIGITSVIIIGGLIWWLTN